MKKKAIALVLLIALLGIPAFAADIRFNTDNIEKWNSIYLGEYDENPIEWLIMDANKNSMNQDGMFLIAKNGLYKTRPSSFTYYPSSGLKDKCASLFDSFDPMEKNIIQSTEARRFNGIDLNDVFHYVTDHAVENEKVFLMSTKEYKKYLEGSDYKNKSLDGAWYLRSNTERWNGQMLVNKYGAFSYTTKNQSFSYYFRPAMNINPRIAAFISPAEGGKESSTGLFPIEEREGVSAWKLTLTDATRKFSASADSVVYSDDRKLVIDYTGAEVDSNEYISAFLLDDEDNILSYGALGRTISGESGSLAITLPEDLKNGSYTLWAFSEQRNGDWRTDYVSAPVELSFTLVDRPAADIPATGDGANIALWCSLAAISAIGMAMLLRKKKEA